ncbi:MAG: ATP-binding cassette domain-containing protein, partial [Mesorhizobium sp.]
MAGVQVSNVSRSFGAHKALDHVSIDFPDGGFYALLGPSGSGKTTLLRQIAGFDFPDTGRIAIGGESVERVPVEKRRIGMVFQNYALFPHMNVFHNIAFPLKQRRVSAAETAERVERALDLVQLKGLGERRVDQLSGGQRQRVALARAIVFEPRIVLMDEPLSALDKGLREHMQIELRNLHRRLGMTTVYVTHDQREAITMSDRIAVMNAGRIEQIDQPEVLYARPKTK